MTEYLIAAVGYSDKEEHIEWLLLVRLSEKRAVGSWLVPRDFAVDLIQTDSATFKTAIFTLRDGKFSYSLGADVRLYDKKFLTTDPNKTERDNLGNLPRFPVPDFEIDEIIFEK